MKNRDITRLDMVKGATVLRQGHFDTLAFTPRNSEGEVVDLTGKSINVKVIGQRGIVYETAGNFNAADSTLHFSISENIGHGEMWMEITVTDPADSTYRQKFPTNEYEGKLFFIRSSDDLDYVGFSGKTVAQFEAAQADFTNKMQEDFDIAVAAVTQDSEVALARMGEASLRAFNQKTTEKLAETAKLSPGKKGILYAGVIRNNGTGWNYVSDAIHKNINFSSIDTTVNNEIVVYFARGKMIGSMVVTPDETLASFGLTCGASVGDTAAFIKSYAPFTGYIDGAGTIVSNDWFNGAYTVAPIGDGTGFTVNYDGGGNGKEKVLATNVRDGAPPHNGLDIRAARGGAGQATLRAYHDLYGYVYYDGSAWQVATSCVANISATFDAGVLTINHDNMSGGVGYNEFQAVNISQRKHVSGGLIHARVNSVAHGQIKVEFYDAAGVLMTTPDTNMRIFMSRPGYRVPHTWNAGAKAYFDFGQALVRPSKLISGNGNLWILGLHESL